MSRETSAPETNKPLSTPCFVCAGEAAALLNCVADKKYNEMRCYPLIKKLRACVEKKVASHRDLSLNALVAARALNMILSGLTRITALLEGYKACQYAHIILLYVSLCAGR